MEITDFMKEWAEYITLGAQGVFALVAAIVSGGYTLYLRTHGSPVRVVQRTFPKAAAELGSVPYDQRRTLIDLVSEGSLLGLIRLGDYRDFATTLERRLGDHYPSLKPPYGRAIVSDLLAGASIRLAKAWRSEISKQAPALGQLAEELRAPPSPGPVSLVDSVTRLQAAGDNTAGGQPPEQQSAPSSWRPLLTDVLRLTITREFETYPELFRAGTLTELQGLFDKSAVKSRILKSGGVPSIEEFTKYVNHPGVFPAHLEKAIRAAGEARMLSVAIPCLMSSAAAICYFLAKKMQLPLDLHCSTAQAVDLVHHLKKGWIAPDFMFVAGGFLVEWRNDGIRRRYVPIAAVCRGEMELLRMGNDASAAPPSPTNTSRVLFPDYLSTPQLLREELAERGIFPQGSVIDEHEELSDAIREMRRDPDPANVRVTYRLLGEIARGTLEAVHPPDATLVDSPYTVFLLARADWVKKHRGLIAHAMYHAFLHGWSQLHRNPRLLDSVIAEMVEDEQYSGNLRIVSGAATIGML